jgi:chromosomal replication initiation ATPase DnaA
LASEIPNEIVYYVEKERYTVHHDLKNHTLEMLNLFKKYHKKLKIVCGDGILFHNKSTPICDY